MDPSYIALIREFGFPVFVALWFMWRLERRVDRIFELMNSHMQATALLAKSVDDHQRFQREQQRNLTGSHPVLHVVHEHDGGNKKS